MDIKNVKISKTAKALLQKGCLETYGKVKDIDKTVKNFLNPKRTEYQFKSVLKILGKNKKNKTVLELGSGSGLLVTLLNKKKINCFGLEPNKNFFLASRKILNFNHLSQKKILNLTGEKLNLRKKFDLIFSFQVIEHTQNPKKVFENCYKHLKKGGKIYFVIPNYHSFWEGHYGIFWLPWLNKKTAKIYVKLFGKNPDFINDLQFITCKKIRKILKELKFKENSLGQKEFKLRMEKAAFKPFGSTGRLLFPLKIIKFLKLNNLIAWILIKTDTFYPLIVSASI